MDPNSAPVQGAMLCTLSRVCWEPQAGDHEGLWLGIPREPGFIGTLEFYETDLGSKALASIPRRNHDLDDP